MIKGQFTILIFLLTVFSSCSGDGNKSGPIKSDSISEISTTIIHEFKSFNEWTLDDFQSKLIYEDIKSRTNEECMFNNTPLSQYFIWEELSPKNQFDEIKNGGKRRFVNWSNIEFVEQEEYQKIFCSGETQYIFTVTVVYEEDAKNTFSFKTIHEFDGKEYTLALIWIDW